MGILCVLSSLRDAVEQSILRNIIHYKNLQQKLIALDWIGKMSGSMSGRDLMVVSTAAALGGGLVAALAFNIGSHFASGDSGGGGGGGGSCKRRSLECFNNFLPRWFWLQWGCSGKGLAQDLTAPAFELKVRKDTLRPCLSKQLHTNLQSGNENSPESSEIDGFEDVGTILKAGELLSLEVVDVPSTSCRTQPTADKPDPYNPSKRNGYMSWDDYFMAIAFLSAKRSKDPNRQVGACIVNQDRVILGIGYNGFPRGCSDDELPWAKRSASGDPLQTKYPYVCHAEVNAILNKNHATATGQRLYVTLFPCNECAKIIIQAGIAEVVFYTDKGAHVENNAGGTEPAYAASRRLLSMAGVKVWQHQPAEKRIVLEFG